jgi:hypothetical protein
MQRTTLVLKAAHIQVNKGNIGNDMGSCRDLSLLVVLIHRFWLSSPRGNSRNNKNVFWLLFLNDRYVKRSPKGKSATAIAVWR